MISGQIDSIPATEPDFTLPPNWTASVEAPKFPERSQRIGKVDVRWTLIKNKALVHSTGGTPQDRYFAENLLSTRLAGFGIERHELDFDEGFRREAAWPDIEAKAKRLVSSGQVTVLRNGYNTIVGHVIGDTGDYTTEISRDDPSSRAISTWQCECAWGKFAWGRTRQWRKYEGRPCAHTLALYWKSLATPLDDYDEEEHGPLQPGQKKAPPPGSAPAGPAGPVGPAPAVPPGQPTTFDPNEPAPSPQPQELTPEEAELMGQPAPPQTDPLPKPPVEQLQEMQPPEPGSTPAGMPAPNQSVSVPGAQKPSPANPIQYPGGTYSRVAASFDSFEEGSIVRTISPVFGMAEGKSKEHGAGQYQEVPEGSTGEVLSQDPDLGWVEVIFPLDGGELTPYHVRVFCNPDELKATRIRPPGPFTRRRH